jgi:hypothetical protein
MGSVRSTSAPRVRSIVRVSMPFAWEHAHTRTRVSVGQHGAASVRCSYDAKRRPFMTAHAPAVRAGPRGASGSHTPAAHASGRSPSSPPHLAAAQTPAGAALSQPPARAREQDAGHSSNVESAVRSIKLQGGSNLARAYQPVLVQLPAALCFPRVPRMDHLCQRLREGKAWSTKTCLSRCGAGYRGAIVARTSAVATADLS